MTLTIHWEYHALYKSVAEFVLLLLREGLKRLLLLLLRKICMWVGFPSTRPGSEIDSCKNVQWLASAYWGQVQALSVVGATKVERMARFRFQKNQLRDPSALASLGFESKGHIFYLIAQLLYIHCDEFGQSLCHLNCFWGCPWGSCSFLFLSTMEYLVQDETNLVFM